MAGSPGRPAATGQTSPVTPALSSSEYLLAALAPLMLPRPRSMAGWPATGCRGAPGRGERRHRDPVPDGLLPAPGPGAQGPRRGRRLADLDPLPQRVLSTVQEGVMAQAGPAPTGAVNQMMQAPGGRLHVSDHPGQDPPPVLLHGASPTTPPPAAVGRGARRAAAGPRGPGPPARRCVAPRHLHLPPDTETGMQQRQSSRRCASDRPAGRNRCGERDLPAAAVSCRAVRSDQRPAAE
jgi:hypothetical protein